MISAPEKRLHARMFGQAVLRMRKEMRLTTEELAEQSGVALHLLGRIEVGAASGNEWGLREICALADVSGVRPDGLMEKWEQFIEEAGGTWWEEKKAKRLKSRESEYQPR